MSCKYIVTHYVTHYAVHETQVITTNIFDSREEAASFIKNDVQECISNEKLTNKGNIHCQQYLNNESPRACVVTDNDDTWTWHTAKIEMNDCTNLPKNRLVYLVNRCIDYIRSTNNTSVTLTEETTILRLLDLGFTEDELIYEFDFDKDTVVTVNNLE